MPNSNLRDLTQRFPLAGRIDTIFLRPARLAPLLSPTEALVEPGRGLIGDRRSAAPRLGDLAQKREVTLLQAEHLPVVAGLLGLPALDPARLRRNLVVSGINLLSMRSLFPDVRLQWRLGDDVILAITGTCEPWALMEAELGEGGYNAMRGHGGVTARVVAGGILRVGDAVRLAA